MRGRGAGRVLRALRIPACPCPDHGGPEMCCQPPSCALLSWQCHQAGGREPRPPAGPVRGRVGDCAAAGLLDGRPHGRGQQELRLLPQQPLPAPRGARGRGPPLRAHQPAAALPGRHLPAHRLPRLPGKLSRPGGPGGGAQRTCVHTGAGCHAEVWARALGHIGQAGQSRARLVSQFHEIHNPLGSQVSSGSALSTPPASEQLCLELSSAPQACPSRPRDAPVSPGRGPAALSLWGGTPLSQGSESTGCTLADSLLPLWWSTGL